MTEIQKRLFMLQDMQYKQFNSKLIPNIDPNTMIGVRAPELRKLAKEFTKREEGIIFLKQLPHQYYEENNLHAFMIGECKEFEQAMQLVDEFLPYIDNWATCDIGAPKVFKKHLNEVLVSIKQWIDSDKTYTIRFGIGTLMKSYLDENFSQEYLELVATLRSEEYYVNMMIAWFFATALAKQYDETISYIQNKRLDMWTHNKTIQKAVESYRITEGQKEYLKSLKIR